MSDNLILIALLVITFAHAQTFDKCVVHHRLARTPKTVATNQSYRQIEEGTAFLHSTLWKIIKILATIWVPSKIWIIFFKFVICNPYKSSPFWFLFGLSKPFWCLEHFWSSIVNNCFISSFNWWRKQVPPSRPIRNQNQLWLGRSRFPALWAFWSVLHWVLIAIKSICLSSDRPLW